MISYSEPLSKLEKIELYALSMHAQELKQNLRYVDYQQAEQTVEQLAHLLQTSFSASELADFAFLPIPRGGYIVLGMLAYALDLNPNQLLTTPEQTDKPLIIVDDCALTGFRFRNYLEKTTAPEVVFAHLFSAKVLRQSILEQESRVSHCIAAQDLAERPSTIPPTLGSHYYWAGSTNLVAFAWSEPSLLTSFLSSNQSNENGNWHLVSPHHCLNNRISLGVAGSPATSSIIFVPESVLYQWQDGVLLLADSASGEFYRLENLPAAMWRALAVLGHPIQAAKWLQSEYGEDVDTGTVTTFLETAVTAGLLAQTETDSPPSIK